MSHRLALSLEKMRVGNGCCSNRLPPLGRSGILGILLFGRSRSYYSFLQTAKAVLLRAAVYRVSGSFTGVSSTGKVLDCSRCDQVVSCQWSDAQLSDAATSGQSAKGGLPHSQEGSRVSHFTRGRLSAAQGIWIES